MTNKASANSVSQSIVAKRPRQKCRWLLWFARRCYFWFLRANGWRPVTMPSPLKGHGLVLKWMKQIGSVRYCLTTEEALITESKFHHAQQRRAAALA